MTTSTVYSGGYEKVTLPGNITEERHNIAGNTVVTYTNRTTSSAGTLKTRYLHKDHLGSVTVITNESGNEVEAFSFDPWGKRRAMSLAQLQSILGNWSTLNTYQKGNLTIPAITLTSATTDKGFTGHRQLDNVGLIHMGGRVYDAEIGRFLSADPFVDDATNLQSLNRYSYVQNNPLSYTDPSGYFLKGLIKKWAKALKSAVSAVIEFERELRRKFLRALGNVEGLSTVISIGLTMMGCPYCAVAFNAAMTDANGGTIGQILTGVAIGFIASGIPGNESGSFWDGGLGARIASGLGGGAPGNIGASLFIGGSIAKAQGGKFIDGVKGAAIGMGIAYGIGRIAQAVKDPPDSTSIELSKKNFSSDEIADIESRLKTAQEDLIGKSFGGGEAGTMAAALALDQNQALTSIANDYGIEPWGVIGGENNTILSVGTGFSSSRSFGSVTSLVANDGHTIWHRHPSGSGLWSGDFHTAANSRAKYNVFASGNNVLEGWFVNRSAYKSGAPLQVQRYRNGAWSQVEFN